MGYHGAAIQEEGCRGSRRHHREGYPATFGPRKSEDPAAFLQDGSDRAPPYRLARSKSLRERRIAIFATVDDIKRGDPDHTIAMADVLMGDRHDLIHKAVGWMLRKVGKRCGAGTLREFLRTRYRNMPRTMLRYAIERFPAEVRAAYLAVTMK